MSRYGVGENHEDEEEEGKSSLIIHIRHKHMYMLIRPDKETLNRMNRTYKLESMRIIDKTHMNIKTQLDKDGKLGHTKHMG